MAREVVHYLPKEEFEQLERAVGNAVVEALVLHIRVVVEFAISKGNGADDILLKNLLFELGTSYLARELTALYGRSNDEASPCWQFNKMLAHATIHQPKSRNYIKPIQTLWPVLADLISVVMSQRPKPMAPAVMSEGLVGGTHCSQVDLTTAFHLTNASNRLTNVQIVVHNQRALHTKMKPLVQIRT